MPVLNVLEIAIGVAALISLPLYSMFFKVSIWGETRMAGNSLKSRMRFPAMSDEK